MKRVFLSAIATSVLLFASVALAQLTTTGPEPPPGTDRGLEPFALAQKVIPAVPAYLWHHGCAPTAAGMVIGYWDGQGFSKLVPGVAATQTAAVNAMIADDSGYPVCSPGSDHYRDYSCPRDDWTPTILPDRSQFGGAHSSNCVADFMRTSWSAAGLRYGWSHFEDVPLALVAYAENVAPGAYVVNAENHSFRLFPWATFKQEIDGGRPVLLLVDTNGDGNTDHLVTAIGYYDTTTPRRYGVRDTWDTNIHWYTWREVAPGRTWGIYGATTFNIARPPANIAYIYSSLSGMTMLDEIYELLSRFPGQYNIVGYYEESLDSLWQRLGEYQVLLLEEDTFAADADWSELGGPIYASFKVHESDLDAFVRQGGAIVSSGANDLLREQAWDWLPSGMRVTSLDAGTAAAVHIVDDPGSPHGLYSQPNAITNEYLSEGHPHGWFSGWDSGYVTTVRRNDNDEAIELMGVFGRGAVVVSHVEAEERSTTSWEFLQNQLNFARTSADHALSLLSPQPGEIFLAGDEVTITAALTDGNGGAVSGAIVTAYSPSGAPISLVELPAATSPGSEGGESEAPGETVAGTGIYTGTYTVLPTDPRGDWVIATVASVGGAFPKHAIRVLVSPNRPPIAEAGADQTLECTGDRRATATLDGSASSDPDSTPGTNDDIVAYNWREAGQTVATGATDAVPFTLGGHSVTLTVTDKGGLTAPDEIQITVLDTRPPVGAITFPTSSLCFGPPSLPVVVTDSFTDVCDPAIAKSYDPAGGPSYSAHGDFVVRLTATDSSGNSTPEPATTAFTIDALPPTVEILNPSVDHELVPSLLPMALLFADGDDDGAAGDVLHEVIKLQDRPGGQYCTLYDGWEYGDNDGLLLDESVTLSVGELCRWSRRCGVTELREPEIRVEAEDCGGNVGWDAHRMRGGLSLWPGVCTRGGRVKGGPPTSPTKPTITSGQPVAPISAGPPTVR